MPSIRAPLASQPLGTLSARNPSSPLPRPLLWSLNLKTEQTGALAEWLARLSNEWEGCKGRAREASAERVCSSRCLPDAVSMGVARRRFPGERAVFTREGVPGPEQGARARCESQLPWQPQHRHLPCCKTPLTAKGCPAPAALATGPALPHAWARCWERRETCRAQACRMPSRCNRFLHKHRCRRRRCHSPGGGKCIPASLHPARFTGDSELCALLRSCPARRSSLESSREIPCVENSEILMHVDRNTPAPGQMQLNKRTQGRRTGSGAEGTLLSAVSNKPRFWVPL